MNSKLREKYMYTWRCSQAPICLL